MKVLKCPQCGIRFETCQSQQTCCSRSCSNKYRAKPPVNLSCSHCKNPIPHRPRQKFRNKNFFCDKTCEGEFRKKRNVVTCQECNTQFEARSSLKRKFCGQKCMGAYYRKNFKEINFKVKRSLAEVFLNYMLHQNFPKMKIIPNDREALEGFEIDLYLIKLGIGIEVSGPHHYYPINGEKALKKIQRRDKMKRGLAKRKGIKIITIKNTTTTSKSTKTKLMNMFTDLCEKLNYTPHKLDCDMSHVDKLYRELRN